MNAPRRPDGPPVRAGKPYSAIARLAEDIVPYVAIAGGCATSISAPAIIDADLDRGLIIMEDLGDERIVAGDRPAPIEARYAAAVDVLAALHGQELAGVLPVAPHLDYPLPRYDMEAFLIEAELLLDWYLPAVGAAARTPTRATFLALWRDALAPAIQAPPTWVLRDYHSPNLLWLPDREDIAQIGVLDFQDALIGPAAYDVASLLQDARVDVAEALEVALLGRYVRARRGQDGHFDAAGFTRSTPRWRRNERPRSSASSPGSTGATASLNICVTFPAYGPICSARWRTRRWRRCKPGTPQMCGSGWAMILRIRVTAVLGRAIR